MRKENGKMGKKVSGRTWAVVILFGLVGQIAWSVENIYFNLFLFNEVGGTTSDISVMVAASAVTATLTTLLMGALSDRVGGRRIFISAGYIAWGAATALFSLISRENAARLVPAASVGTVAVLIVIVMDCVMTFMGSTANDANFNAWVTETVDSPNRGKVEGVLAVFPLLAMVIVTGVSGILIESIGYPLFFASLGGLVSLAGLTGLLVTPKGTSTRKQEGNYFSDLSYGFRPAVIRENRTLYLALLCLGVFGISFQIVMPFLIIYMEHYLEMSAMTYSIVLVTAIFVSSVIGILLGRLVDRFGRRRFGFAAVGIFVLGLLMLFLVRDAAMVAAAGIVMLAGNLLLSIVINTAVRDSTPKDKVGLFQGVRMIFFVLLPMTVGPALGNAVIQGGDITFVNEYNEVTKIPTPGIFLAAAIVAVLITIPMALVLKCEKKETAYGKNEGQAVYEVRGGSSETDERPR